MEIEIDILTFLTVIDTTGLRTVLVDTSLIAFLFCTLISIQGHVVVYGLTPNGSSSVPTIHRSWRFRVDLINAFGGIQEGFVEGIVASPFILVCEGVVDLG